MTDRALQQKGGRAFNARSSPRESWLNPSELKPARGFLRYILFINVEVGDFSILTRGEGAAARGRAGGEQLF